MAKLIEITGKAISGEWGSDDETGTGVPILRTTNFTNDGVINFNNVVTRTITKKNISDKYLRCGDIIIEKSGGSDKQPVGRVVYYEGPDNIYLFNNFTGLLRIQDRNIWNSKYVFYALYRNYCQGGTLAFENKTTGLHNLKIDDFVSKVDIREAPLPIQEQICSVIDRVRLIIATRKQQLNELDNLVKARFVEMFWGEDKFMTMSEVCSIITDGTHQPPKFSDRGIPFIFVSNITNNKVTYDTDKFIDQITYDELIKRTPIEVGDILLSTVGSYGHPAIVRADRKFLFQRHIAYLKPHKDIIDSDYLHSAILSPGVQKQIEEGVRGIAQKTLNLSEIKKMIIPVPRMKLQQQFAAFVAQVDKSKVAVQAALDEAQTLFGSLMQQYFG